MVWTAAGGMIGLGLTGGGPPQSVANRVSGDGTTVVGFRKVNASDPRAFRWNGGSKIDITSNKSQARDVNSDGSVIVGWSGNTPIAFRWTGGSPVSLGHLGGFSSEANAVSADGNVVVGRSSGQSFRWTQGTGMVGIGGEWAFDTSADGSVVVGKADSHAYRWTQETGIENLGELTVTTGPLGEALSVSADGSVVVGWSNVDAPSGQAAFIWDSFHGMRNLRTILTDDLGLDLTGWSLEKATGISSDGLTIVGWGSAALAAQAGSQPFPRVSLCPFPPPPGWVWPCSAAWAWSGWCGASAIGFFNLGKTLYQLLTGQEPLLVDTSKVPDGLAHVIRKATRDHPDDRYQKVGQLLDAVHTYRKASDPEAHPIGAFEAVMINLPWPWMPRLCK